MKIKIVLFSLIILSGTEAFTQKKGAKKLPVNEPLPKEFLEKSNQIYFEKSIDFIDSGKQIYTTYGTTFLLHALVESQVAVKEREIAKMAVFKNDLVELPKILVQKYEEQFAHSNIAFAEDKEKSSYKLVIKVFDHGFHWATSSAAGLFIRTKVELVSSEGETVWEQYYLMDKKEAKVPFNCKGMNMNRAIDKNIENFEKNSGLLYQTYNQIAGFLAAKLIPDLSLGGTN
jgi:hypothetical protein